MNTQNGIRTSFISLILVLILSLCGCSSSPEKNGDLTKVDNNLYELYCSNYDYDYLLSDGYGNIDFLNGGCSAIKQGNYLGRNFDFVAGDSSEIVVRTDATEDHYASVGMVGGLFWLTSVYVESGLNEDDQKLLPLVLLDGINDKGLAVEINCVNSTDAGGLTMHTNPGKKEVHQLAVVRYLLDKAASADEAIDIMKNIDIVNTRDVMGLVANNFEIHFLVADKDKSYVVEFDNTLPEGEKLVVMEDEAIMTNFYLHSSNFENETYPDHSMGVERYRKLRDNASSVNSVESMKELMQSIRFTNSNRQDGEYDPGENYDNPYTCYTDHPVMSGDAINYGNYKNHIPEILENMKNDEAKVAAVLKDPELKNPDRLWVTSHNTVYDLVNKTMSVAVFERYDSYYDYSV